MKASLFISSLCPDQINLITVVMFSVDSKNAIHDPLVDSLMIRKSTLCQLRPDCLHLLGVAGAAKDDPGHELALLHFR